MEAPFSASGRFYRLFYRWSKHTAKTHHKWNAPSRRALSICTSQTARQDTRIGCTKSSHNRFLSSAARPVLEENSQTSKSNSRLGTNTSNIDIHPTLSSHMRQIMRKIPHPVTVITASTPPSASAPIESTFRGMTVSSFNSVTLEPTPLVSFNVRTPSATHTAMTANPPNTFLAHILSASAAGARIGDAFARGGNRGGEVFQELVTSSPSQQADVQIFAGERTHGAPLLSGPAIMQVLRCKLLPGKEVDVGDHTVVVAEVLGILTPPRRSPLDEQGLLYSDGRFRAPGPPLESTVPAPAMHSTTTLNVRRGDERP